MEATRQVELMSSVDRAWLEMDERHNPMVASAIFQLDGSVRAPVIAETISQRLLSRVRFRQRPDDAHRPPRWIEDESIKLDYHVHLKRLTEPDHEAQLRSAIGEELSNELDRCRPLWRMVFYTRPDGLITVLFRAHHAVADGIALLHVLLGCVDHATRKPENGQASIERPAHEGPLGGLIDQLEAANSALETLYRVALDDLHQPRHLVEQLREGQHILGAVGRLLGLPENNPTEFRRPLSGHRAVAWLEELPFSRFHRFSKVHTVKINDLFIACLAGAFGRYLRATTKDFPESQNLRISIPVNLRSESDNAGQGNYFGLVLLDLPVGVSDPQERLRIVSQRMKALKDSGEARAVFLSLAVAGHLPVVLEKKLVNQVAGKSAAVVSNLRGPKRLLKIAGSTMRNVVFWPPQSGGIGLGLSLFSYAGKVSVGVSADTEIIKHPQLLMDAFRETVKTEMRFTKPRSAS